MKAANQSQAQNKEKNFFIAEILLVGLLLYINLLAPIHTNILKTPSDDYLTCLSARASQSSQENYKMASGVVYWHAFEGYSIKTANILEIGHDFDFWNEEWRSFCQFNISSIPSGAQITSCKIGLEVIGKPAACDEVDAQLVLTGLSENLSALPDAERFFLTMNQSESLLANWTGLDQENNFNIGDNFTASFSQDGLAFVKNSISQGWLTFGFQDYSDGGHGADVDEGLSLLLRNLTIEYSLSAVNQTWVFLDESSADIADSGRGGWRTIIPVIIGMGLILGILLIIGLRGPQRKKSKHSRHSSPHSESIIYPFRLSGKGTTESKESMKIKRRTERELFKKFRDVMEASRKISMEYISSYLEIDKKDLFGLLMRWKQKVPFVIDGEMLIVEDMQSFIESIDDKFEDWEKREENHGDKKL